MATITHEQRSLSSTITSRKSRAQSKFNYKIPIRKKKKIQSVFKGNLRICCDTSIKVSLSKKESLDFLLDVVFKQRVGQRIEGGVRNVQKANDVVGNDRLVKGTEISTEVEIRICCVADYQDKHDEADEPCGGDFEAVFLLPMEKWMVKL